MNQNYNHHN